MSWCKSASQIWANWPRLSHPWRGPFWEVHWWRTLPAARLRSMLQRRQSHWTFTWCPMNSCHLAFKCNMSLRLQCHICQLPFQQCTTIVQGKSWCIGSRPRQLFSWRRQIHGQSCLCWAAVCHACACVTVKSIESGSWRLQSQLQSGAFWTAKANSTRQRWQRCSRICRSVRVSNFLLGGAFGNNVILSLFVTF